jgi:hypothetical protein
MQLRPAPRWAKWSRGVRTRGLRVGLVGGAHPFSFWRVIMKKQEPGNLKRVLYCNRGNGEVDS